MRGTAAVTCLALSLCRAAAGTSFEDAAAELRSLIAQGVQPELRWPEFSAYRERIAEFYSGLHFALVWTRAGQPTIQCRAVIRELESADAKGLDREDYDGSRWPGRLSKLSKSDLTARELSRFDLALTIAAMRYVSDLRDGKANPHVFFPGFEASQEKFDYAGWLRDCLTGDRDLQAAFRSLEPPFPGYRRTQQALQLYRELESKSSGDGQTFATAIEPGELSADVPKLLRLLRLLGDLPQDTNPGPQPDVYGPALVEAVKRFQTRHGLSPDGRIGPATLRQLNMPLSRRVRQLQLTLERWRWVPRGFSRPPIVVNIPEFELRCLNDSYRTGLQMKVVVGRAYHHRTPVFAAELKYVVFQPYWDVPLSIVRAEILPVLARDRYLRRYPEFEILTANGMPVAERPVSDRTLELLRSGKWRMRQLPGLKNPLGPVKFIFPNENNVYLHATPEQNLFSKSRRDFSHGCIRAEKPQELAEWVLRDNPEWPRERIEEAMNRPETVQIRVIPPIPVFIVYATAVVPESTEVRFFDDIYGEDALLEEQLTGPHP